MPKIGGTTMEIIRQNKQKSKKNNKDLFRKLKRKLNLEKKILKEINN